MPIQECESLGRWGWRIYLHCPHLPLLPAGGSIGHHFLEIERDCFSKIYFLSTFLKLFQSRRKLSSEKFQWFFYILALFKDPLLCLFSKYNNFHWECVDFGQKSNCFWQWRVEEIPKPNWLFYLPVLSTSLALFWYKVMYCYAL